MFRRLRESLRQRPTGSSAALQALAALPVRIASAGSRPLVYRTASGSAHLLSPGAASLLAQLEGCRPLRSDRLGVALDELRGRGLVISREALLQKLLSAADSDPPSRIASVAWLTRSRPAALARSIRSFAANAARHDRAPRWMVFDDGDPGQAAQTLETLRPLAVEGINLSYCGPGEKARMAARLVDAARGAVPEDVVRFALLGLPGYGTTCGANRNCAMLALLGASLLVADDDTVCEPARHPDAVDALSITSERDPSDLLCHDDRQSLLASVTRADADFLAAHESLLGRSAGGCARQWPADRIDLEAVSPALAELLVRGGGRVMATTAGTYGDAIVGDPTALLWLDGDARARIVASEERFRAALSIREVLRCPRGPAIGDSDVAMGASLGLDARTLLPPFLPMGRGQDLLFSQTLKICVGDALIGRPALALLHEPIEQRSYPTERPPLPAVQSFDLIAWLERSHSFSPWVEAADGRLRSVGSALEALGRLPPADFADVTIPPLLSARAAQINAAEALLRRYRREPSYWAREVDRAIEGMQRLMAERPIAPIDVPQGSSRADATAAFQRQVGLYGELLQAWPAIWRAARELAADGPWGGVDLA